MNWELWNEKIIPIIYLMIAAIIIGASVGLSYR